MTPPDQDRVRLAEAMGWKLVEHCGTERWIAPGSLGFTGYLDGPNFEPFTDATDCHAVIKHLTEQGYTVHVQIGPNGQSVDAMSVEDDYAYVGDNWMQGVCELALKVLPTGSRDE